MWFKKFIELPRNEMESKETDTVPRDARAPRASQKMQKAIMSCKIDRSYH
jgi:hypothetical protein